MNDNRKFALITGYSLLLMVIISGFVFGYAFPKLFNFNAIDIVKLSLSDHFQLYKFMILGLVLILILDIFVSWSLYNYFKNDNKTIAFLGGVSRIIYVIIFGIAIYHLSNNIGEIDSTTYIGNYTNFQKIWSYALIDFGIHLFFVGLSMKIHKLIPGYLWILVLIAAFDYLLIHTLKISLPELSEMISILEKVFGLPMALGEIGLALWLIIKGAKPKLVRI
jgi:hypothetical protein